MWYLKTKYMYLVKPKQPIIWDGGSDSLNNRWWFGVDHNLMHLHLTNIFCCIDCVIFFIWEQPFNSQPIHTQILFISKWLSCRRRSEYWDHLKLGTFEFLSTIHRCTCTSFLTRSSRRKKRIGKRALVFFFFFQAIPCLKLRCTPRWRGPSTWPIYLHHCYIGV